MKILLVKLKKLHTAACLKLNYCITKHGESWGRVLLGGMIKNEQIQFFDSQMYCNNLNTITLKLFHNHGGICRLRKKFKKDSGEINPLRIHRNMRVYILEINCEGLGWQSTVCLPIC